MRVVRHRDRRRRARWRRGLWGAGEALVTLGVVVMLLVVHQVWWTNREARQGAARKVEAMEREWGGGFGAAPAATPGGASADSAPSASGGSDGSDGSDGSGGSGGHERAVRRQRSSYGSATLVSDRPRDSQAYAVLTVPRLNLRVPVAEGVSKANVLDKGYVGHYPGTQQPGQAGNFALAGHRNTRGEPFRYLPRLRLKDVIQVETQGAVYVYAVDRILPQTSARDSGVVRPVPHSIVRPGTGTTSRATTSP